MKPIIYQLLPRLFTNANTANIPGGDIDQNGSGKFNDIDDKIIASLKDLGITHIWLTGIIEHATATDYSAHGIAPDNPHIVKGKPARPTPLKTITTSIPIWPSTSTAAWRNSTHSATGSMPPG